LFWIIIHGSIEDLGELMESLGLLVADLGKWRGWCWMEQCMDEGSCCVFGGIG
jgi:hypothetical protein